VLSTSVTPFSTTEMIGYPAEPLVSYQINRQFSGWNLPPLMIRAFGAYCHVRTSARQSGDLAALQRDRAT
jgi:hypothetical protein